jgi:hypothetical protein
VELLGQELIDTKWFPMPVSSEAGIFILQMIRTGDAVSMSPERREA